MSAGFADVEALYVAHLHAYLGGVRVVTMLPADVETMLPVVRVIAAGGSDDRVTDTVRLDVEALAADRPTAHDLAELCRTAMLASAHRVLFDGNAVGWLIDTVSTEARPMWIDYQNDKVRRYIATYSVASRIRG